MGALGIFLVIEVIGLVTGWYSLKTGLYIGIAAAAMSLLHGVKLPAGGASSPLQENIIRFLQGVWGIIISIIVLPFIIWGGMIMWKYLFPGVENTVQFYSAPIIAYLIMFAASAIISGGSNIRGTVGIVTSIFFLIIISSFAYDWVVGAKRVEYKIRAVADPDKPGLAQTFPSDWQQQVLPGDTIEIIVTGESTFLTDKAETVEYGVGGVEPILGNGIPFGAVIPVVTNDAGGHFLEIIDFQGRPKSYRTIVTARVPDGVEGMTNISYNVGISDSSSVPPGDILQPLYGQYDIVVRMNPPPSHDYLEDSRKVAWRALSRNPSIYLPGPGKKSRTINLAEYLAKFGCEGGYKFRYGGVGNVRIHLYNLDGTISTEYNSFILGQGSFPGNGKGGWVGRVRFELEGITVKVYNSLPKKDFVVAGHFHGK